jgi:mxaJ protein
VGNRGGTVKWTLVFAALTLAAPAQGRTIKVCADPNNLPFSNAREEGFENRIVRIVAGELKADVEYVWWAQRRGNVRETLNQGLCDLIPGVASTLEMLATTRPYYRSAYVAVVRDPALKTLSSFDDPRLQSLRIGVQLIGDDGANTPPAHALARRGIVDGVRGYPVYGDYSRQAPQEPILRAVADGEIDAAFVWGPTAGYFASREKQPLALVTVSPLSDGPGLPMAFDVSMGLRRGDRELKREVEAALEAHSAEIRHVLEDYGVPLVDP